MGFSLDEIRQKLGKMIFENRLQHFYPPQRVEELSQQVSNLDVVGLGRRWNLPREVQTFNKALMYTGAEYNHIIY